MYSVLDEPPNPEVHKGLNTRTGHYYAYVKDPMRMSPTGQQWAKCDCLSTKFIQHIDFEALKADSFLSENVTLLIFERNGMGPPPDSSLWTTIAKATGSRTKTATQFEPTEDATQFEPEPTKTTAQFEPTEDATQFEPTETTMQFEPIELSEYEQLRAEKIARNNNYLKCIGLAGPTPGILQMIQTFGPKEKPTPPRKRKSAPEVIVPPRPKSKRKVRETSRLSFGQNGTQQTAKESEQAVKAFFKSDDKLKAGRKGRATAQTMDEDNSEDRKDGSYEYEADVADESSEGVIEENGDEDNAEDDKGAACENQGDGEEEPLEEEVIVEEGDFQPPNSLPGFPTSEPIMLFKSEGCEKLHEVIVLSQGGAPGSISFPVHDKASTIKVAVQKLRPFSDHSTDQLSIIQAIVEEFINHQFEVPVGIFLSM